MYRTFKGLTCTVINDQHNCPVAWADDSLLAERLAGFLNSGIYAQLCLITADNERLGKLANAQAADLARLTAERDRYKESETANRAETLRAREALLVAMRERTEAQAKFQAAGKLAANLAKENDNLRADRDEWRDRYTLREGHAKDSKADAKPQGASWNDAYCETLAGTQPAQPKGYGELLDEVVKALPINATLTLVINN